MVLQWLTDLTRWWAELPAAAVFLFLVPFAVAAAALLADLLHRR
ncbi:hypothetical protein [Ramlibacter sp.]|nr:hypothetical protein [Ramlibacter sp.]HWI83808.1 hypothetical protein [Ramlibacter sp.]